MTPHRLSNYRSIIVDSQLLKIRSRKINWLKRLLPFMALTLLIVLVCWSGGTKIIFLKHKDITTTAAFSVLENNMALNPHFNGVDARGHPYTISADQGKQVSSEAIQLTHPKFHLTLGPDTFIELEAKEGMFFNTLKVLELKEDVILNHSQGHRISTASATINFDLAECLALQQ